MRTIIRTVELVAGLVLAPAAIDCARVLGYGLCIERMRAKHPEMFDGALALANVEAALAEAR